MVGTISIPDWLKTAWVLSQFGGDRPRAAYIDLVRTGIGLPSIWEALRNQIYLGSDGFSEKVSRGMRGREDLPEVPRAQRRSLAKPLWTSRRHSMTVVRRWPKPIYTMREIADHFHVHYATVSRAVRRELKLRTESRPHGDGKHLNCRIKRPDPVLSHIAQRHKVNRRLGLFDPTGIQARSAPSPCSYFFSFLLCNLRNLRPAFNCETLETP